MSSVPFVDRGAASRLHWTGGVAYSPALIRSEAVVRLIPINFCSRAFQTAPLTQLAKTSR